MRLGQPLSLNEYYLWRKKVQIYPWQRHHNGEFLKNEWKRIVARSEWLKKFRKAETEKLNEISFYAVPVKLSTRWKTAIAEMGGFYHIGFSALCNSPQAVAIGLIPLSMNPPQEYRLIQITKSKKKLLRMNNSRFLEPIMIIEDWYYLPSDYIYLDVPYEKRIVSKIIRETLIDDEQISLSFQSPILSAPFDGSLGGISLSSIAGSSPFAEELVKTTQLMVPPEYRTLKPPKSVYRGFNFQYMNGVRFHLAERPYFDNNLLSSFWCREYLRLGKELSRRSQFAGEFSIFSTLNPQKGGTDIWKLLLLNFTDTEITLPWDLDELLEADVHLKSLKKAITEDLWIQVVNARQYNPGTNIMIDDKLTRIKIQLKKDLEAILYGIQPREEDAEYMARSMLNTTFFNCLRIAQSLSRSDEREELNNEDLIKARRLVVDNLTGFVEHPAVERIRMRMEESKADKRFLVVQTELLSNPRSSADEIFQAVKQTGLFSDLLDLQGLLDWMQKKGYVIANVKKKYIWV